MRRYLIRFLVFLLMLTLGISIPMLWSVMTSDVTIRPLPIPRAEIEYNSPLPFVIHDPCNDNAGFLKESSFVVSIPNDHEIYVGKERVALGEITNITNPHLQSEPCDCRIAYIKAADFVKFGKVDSVIKRLKKACVNRIGIVAAKRVDFKRARVD